MTRILLAIVLVLAVSGSASAQIEVELTFDDGPDGSGPDEGRAEINNLETDLANFGAGAVTATLIGTSRRSAIDEGRYGRAADLIAGTGGIELSPWQPYPTRVYYLWLRPRDTSGGFILSQEDSFDVHFDEGEIVVGAYRSTGEYVSFAPGALWPDDGAFHHLTLQLDGSGTTPTVTITIDVTTSPPVDVGFVPRASSGPLQLGVGYDGLLDELLIKKQDAPTNADRFDRNPVFCPAGTTCVEEVITIVPRDFPHEVPVRFKTVYDEAVCTPTSPCPVLFEVSGGNRCADDYSGPGAVGELVDAGFVVVAVDLYCEDDESLRPFPQETSQLIAVKDYVLTMGAARDRISDAGYVASGCSHGAGTVAQWAMLEDDYPVRAYSRSNGVAGLCDFVADALCPDVVDAGLATLGVDDIAAVDLESAEIQEGHERGDLVGRITEEMTRTREIARSWGINLEGSVCRADGSYACNEEGLYGVTYSSRRYADVWERTQPADTPTGYFVEDHSTDCQHCAAPTSEAFRCGVCLLRVGRVGMETECPECLAYDDPTIERGAPGELCPIDASWYTDPLAETADPDQDTDAGPDAGPLPDVGPSADAGPSGDDDGCGCATASGTEAGWFALWLAIVWLSLPRRRAPTGGTSAMES